MSTQSEITDYIKRELLFEQAERLPAPDEPLVGAGGAVDSVGLHQLALHIEKQYGFEVEMLDLVPDNFGTINALVAYIDCKRAAGN